MAESNRLNPMELKRKRRLSRKLKLGTKEIKKVVAIAAAPKNNKENAPPSVIKTVPIQKEASFDQLFGLQPKRQKLNEPEEQEEEEELPYPGCSSMNLTTLTSRIDQLYSSRTEIASTATPVTRKGPETIQCSEIPIDFSLKSKVVITSTFPCDKVLPSVRIQSLLSTHQLPTDENDTIAYEWEKARRYYSCSLNLTTADSNKASTLDWQMSFRSAYYTLRSSSQPMYFYIVCGNFVAGFFTKQQPDQLLSQSTTTAHDVYAILSRSTSSLREELKRYEVEFSIPFETQYDPIEEDEEVVQELREFENAVDRTARVSLPVSNRISGLNSLLFFNSPDGVHGIYNLLLNTLPNPDRFGAEKVDLLAPFEFQGAKRDHLRIQHTDQIQSGKQLIYRMEINQIVLPLSRFCQLMADLAQEQDDEDSNFQVTLEQLQPTARFNYLSKTDKTKIIRKLSWTKRTGFEITLITT